MSAFILASLPYAYNYEDFGKSKKILVHIIGYSEVQGEFFFLKH